MAPTPHPVFADFSRVPSTGTGQHTFDFTGTATRGSFKRGWEKHITPAGVAAVASLPPPNEHYLDWIALLSAVSKADDCFRMAELGAGYAPWVVRGAMASRQNQSITSFELLAVEADPVHYSWAREHFSDNALDPGDYWLLEGAVSTTDQGVAFPVIAAPEEDYGAGLLTAATASATRHVASYTLQSLLEKFSGPLDLLHIDIQGEEYRVMPDALPAIDRAVKSIVIGTHVNDSQHDQLVALMEDAGWLPQLVLSRNTEHDLPWGQIKTNDGFLWLLNPAFP
jgi:FkbM family methyltransferase